MYETHRQAKRMRYASVDQIDAGSNSGLAKEGIGIRIDRALGSK